MGARKVYYAVRDPDGNIVVVDGPVPLEDAVEAAGGSVALQPVSLLGSDLSQPVARFGALTAGTVWLAALLPPAVVGGAAMAAALARATRLAGVAPRPLDVATEKAEFETLVEALQPKTPFPTAPAVVAALRNARLRTAFLEQHGALTSTQVAEIAGSRARNPHAIASRWRKDGRIFAVPWAEAWLYPAFQFRDGVPRPSVARVIDAFGGRASPWEMAIWWVTPSGYLSGERRSPIDWLDDPDRLVAAVTGDTTLPEF
jgi:hypothetical protein